MSNNLILLGLPGAGKSRFASKLLGYCEEMGDALPVLLSENTRDIGLAHIWTVIDIRSTLSDDDAETYLTACLQQSTAVVFAFTESADLSMQSFWQNWLKQRQVTLPVVRWFSQAFANGWRWQAVSAPRACGPVELPELDLQSFSFSVGKLHLEHLLFGLDAAKQNLGMSLWRVKAKVWTQEYVNPVAIEGTLNRWDTFAAETTEPTLEILGKHLDESLLNEIVKASSLPTY